MNSSIIMFSNMFSDIYFYKHCKRQSLLQCDKCGATGADIFGSRSFRPISKNSLASVPMQRHLASLRHGSHGMDCAPFLFSPERIKLGLASAGPFS
ncbi:hypothetical protein [Rhizobium leguminosarum]|uniref:hypothetical protein n=1 Tax=Rhizobium leguminosarum TaxID=384 RepID=UPI0014427BA7|nr:hypothetical protein [Rhizobium leguminosarum]